MNYVEWFIQNKWIAFLAFIIALPVVFSYAETGDSAKSSWRKLAKYYGTKRMILPIGKNLWPMGAAFPASLGIGGSIFKGGTVAVCDDGLFLSWLPLPFFLFPRLLIPWSAMRLEEKSISLMGVTFNSKIITVDTPFGPVEISGLATAVFDLADKKSVWGATAISS